MASLPAYLPTATLSVLSPARLEGPEPEAPGTSPSSSFAVSCYAPPISRKLNVWLTRYRLLLASNFLRMRYLLRLFLILFKATFPPGVPRRQTIDPWWLPGCLCGLGPTSRTRPPRSLTFTITGLRPRVSTECPSPCVISLRIFARSMRHPLCNLPLNLI